MAYMIDLPAELLVKIFRDLPLIALTQIRNVCFLLRDDWLLSDVHPVRRRLLDIHSRLVRSPRFLSVESITKRTARILTVQRTSPT